MSYKPTRLDLAFMQNVVEMVKEGGVWGFPNAMLIYRISRMQKTFTLLNENILEFAYPKAMHLRTIVVMKELGYRVLPEEE